MAKAGLKSKKSGGILALFVRVAFIGLIIWSLISIVSVQVTNANKREELAALQLKTEALIDENDELQRMLNITDQTEYIERLAIEQFGYSYPGERRFYDLARN